MSSYSEDLLTQADKLLRADPRKPKQANLRRAVSSAYYGLFHFLIEETTSLIVGTANTNKPLRQLVGRGFSHTAMKEASAEFTKTTPRDLLKPFWALYSIPQCVPLARVASAFFDLQQERHRADYDLSQPLTLKEAEALVKRARAAIGQWETLKKSHPDIAQFLFSWNSWKTR